MIQGKTRQINLQPLFLTEEAQLKFYTPHLSLRVSNFVGWREDITGKWELSSDKLVFKRYMESYGLPTPKYSTSNQA